MGRRFGTYVNRDFYVPIPEHQKVIDERDRLRRQLDFMIKHAGLEWHGWWESRLDGTPEPMRQEMKALLFPKGYPREQQDSAGVKADGG